MLLNSGVAAALTLPGRRVEWISYLVGLLNEFPIWGVTESTTSCEGSGASLNAR